MEICKCWACGEEFPYISDRSPMLKDEIWKEIAKDEPHEIIDTVDGKVEVGGFLCDKCMEKRLGRPIEVSDLMMFDDSDGFGVTHVPFNTLYLKKHFPNELESERKPWLLME